MFSCRFCFAVSLRPFLAALDKPVNMAKGDYVVRQAVNVHLGVGAVVGGVVCRKERVLHISDEMGVFWIPDQAFNNNQLWLG